VTNAEIARVFSHVAVMLELDGANPFRVRAYREAARVIGASVDAIAVLAPQPGVLEELPGIGKDIAGKIREVCATGSTPIYAELQQKYPLTVVELTDLQGLGPKRVATLFTVLGVRTRDDLEKAARDGRLRTLPGFGEKVEQNVLKAIASAAKWAGRLSLAAAWPLAHALADAVMRVEGVTQVEIAGSFRRRKDTIGDVDLVVCGGSTEAVMERFVTHPSVAEVLGRGDTKSSVKLGMGLQVDLRHVPESAFGAALLYFTGSKEHNIELRRIAIERGMSLNEYGLTRGEEVVASRTEADIYRALGIDQWIPPELREARGEIDLAREGRLPDLVDLKDVRADLHMHTTRSDGRDSIETMIRACRDRGYEYAAITEHSKALPMAYGFDAARVRQSIGEIEAVRKQFPDFPILHGLEVDILGDGALDLDDATLALLDWVVISIHSLFEMTPPDATARVLRALENPYVHVFGHPTGRMIGSRAGLPFDMERAVETAARRGVLMELNAGPDRLDLDEPNARLAKSKGCRFVIDTDAHSTVQLDNLRYGVFQARRAGLTRDDVWNTRRWPEFSKWLEERRRARPAVGASATTPAEAETLVREVTEVAAKAKRAGAKAAKTATSPKEAAAKPAITAATAEAARNRPAQKKAAAKKTATPKSASKGGGAGRSPMRPAGTKKPATKKSKPAPRR